MYKPHTHSCLFNSLVSLFSSLPSGSNQVCLTSAIIVLYRFSQAVSYVLLICMRHLATHVTCYFHHLARSEFAFIHVDQLINDCLSIGLPTGP
ncbi:hypothetical protein BDR03DRAFT_961336 [Suillus americanus]|nr:hypothetical protein BDR03DRAFT_961336 [Suillus americanus]